MYRKARRSARQGTAPSHILAEIKRSIRDRVSLPDLAPRLGIEKKGGGWLCPFHDDHDPSFGLRDDHFCCFACGAKGDCFDLVARLRECSFMEALEELCVVCGLNFPFTSLRRGLRILPPPVRVIQRRTEPPIGAPLDPERRSEILTEFARSIAIGPNAHDTHPVLRYLQRRGISPSTARRHPFAYIGDYQATQKSLVEQFPLSELQDAGLFNERGNLRLLRHQMVMPFALGGRAHGVQARNIDWRSKAEDGPKELLVGSPEIPFGCDVLAEGVDRVFLTEGVIDCLSLCELGLPAVGVPGAMGFKSAWAPLFKNVPEVIVAFDNDEAGRRGTRKVVEAFEASGRAGLRVLAWPADIKDANEFFDDLNRFHYMR